MVTADPAFNLESISDDEAWKLLDEEKIPHNEQMIAVSVRNWSKAFGGDDYVKKVAKCVIMLLQRAKLLYFFLWNILGIWNYPKGYVLYERKGVYYAETIYSITDFGDSRLF